MFGIKGSPPFSAKSNKLRKLKKTINELDLPVVDLRIDKGALRVELNKPTLDSKILKKLLRLGLVLMRPKKHSYNLELEFKI